MENTSNVCTSLDIFLAVTQLRIQGTFLLPQPIVNYRAVLAMSVVRAALVLALYFRPSLQQATTDPSSLLPSYDYIICGGGTAGLTVATRLSENQNVTVLVVEAGKAGSNDNWDYPSVPAEFAAGRTQKLPAGKTLGGSSAINGE